MLRCANRGCSRESLYFRDGNLFLVDREGSDLTMSPAQRTQQTVWLCPRCCAAARVESWRPPGEQIRAMEKKLPRSVSPAEAAFLRAV
jgi:hypothetical protein